MLWKSLAMVGSVASASSSRKTALLPPPAGPDNKRFATVNPQRLPEAWLEVTTKPQDCPRFSRRGTYRFAQDRTCMPTAPIPGLAPHGDGELRRAGSAVCGTAPCA